MFILTGVLRGLITIFFVVSSVFFIIEILPGDPAEIIAGELATPQEIENIRQKLGLNIPLTQRYLRTISSLITLNFGRSLFTGEDIGDVIKKRVKNTAELACTTMLFSTVFALFLFYLYMRFQNAENIITTITTVIYSIPNFWIGVMLIIILAVKAKLFPVSGYQSLSGLVLPSVTLGLSLGIVLSRFLKNLTEDALSSDFATFLKAKGVDGMKFYMHILKYIAPGVITVLGIQAGTLLSGVVVTETVFSFPGIGLFTVESVMSRDFPAILASVFVISSVWVGINLTTDIIIKIIDPRTR